MSTPLHTDHFLTQCQKNQKSIGLLRFLTKVQFFLKTKEICLLKLDVMIALKKFQKSQRKIMLMMTIRKVQRQSMFKKIEILSYSIKIAKCSKTKQIKNLWTNMLLSEHGKGIFLMTVKEENHLQNRKLSCKMEKQIIIKTKCKPKLTAQIPIFLRILVSDMANKKQICKSFHPKIKQEGLQLVIPI